MKNGCTQGGRLPLLAQLCLGRLVPLAAIVDGVYLTLGFLFWNGLDHLMDAIELHKNNNS